MGLNGPKWAFQRQTDGHLPRDGGNWVILLVFLHLYLFLKKKKKLAFELLRGGKNGWENTNCPAEETASSLAVDCRCSKNLFGIHSDPPINWMYPAWSKSKAAL